VLISLKPPETGLALNLSPALSPAPILPLKLPPESGAKPGWAEIPNSEFRIPKSIRLSHVFPGEPNVLTLKR